MDPGTTNEQMVETGFFLPDAKLRRLTAAYASGPGTGLVAAPSAHGVDRYRRGGTKLLSGP